MRAPVSRLATESDLFAIPDGERHHELLGHEIVERAAPTGEHADAQGGIIATLRPRFHRGRGDGGPGGWWLLPEVEVRLSTNDVVRPDVAGWRRETCPERPRGTPVAARPDWICEVVSPATARNDLVRKLHAYRLAGIPHYWIVDPRDETLTVQRLGPDGWLLVLRATRGETVRAEPFDEIEIAVGALLGDAVP